VQERFTTSTRFYVAEDKNRIVGVLRAVGNRIVNLFVAGSHLGKGIGIRLLYRYEKTFKRDGYQEVVLRSQLYAVPFYLACGYNKITGMRTKFGLTTQPMKKLIATQIPYASGRDRFRSDTK